MTVHDGHWQGCVHGNMGAEDITEVGTHKARTAQKCEQHRGDCESCIAADQEGGEDAEVLLHVGAQHLIAQHAPPLLRLLSGQFLHWHQPSCFVFATHTALACSHQLQLSRNLR